MREEIKVKSAQDIGLLYTIIGKKQVEVETFMAGLKQMKGIIEQLETEIKELKEKDGNRPD